MVRFTVITPTVLRETLLRTCQSIDECTFKDIQHIIVADVVVPPTDWMMRVSKPYREWLVCGRTHGYVGNRCRNSAFDHIKGEYVLYLDDDDWYINDALAVLDKEVRGEWGVFPALRMGSRFYNPCPGSCATMSCQFYHRPWVKGVKMDYPTPDGGCADGMLVERLKATGVSPWMIQGVELSNVDRQQFGGRPDLDGLSVEKWRKEYGELGADARGEG